MKHKVGFCYEIFKNQAFWSHNASIAYNPCSFYDGHIDHDIPPDQSWWGENHRDLIDQIDRNQLVSGCHRCYAEERAGRQSRRQASAALYEDFLHSSDLTRCQQGPEGLDYSVGNLCNLRCMICGPKHSTAWIPDYQKMYPHKDITQYLFKKNSQTTITDDRYLGNIKSIHFHGGGEPLMGDAHMDLLRRVQKVKGLKDVRVFYNTNGTQRVTDQVLEIWSQCRLVEIYFSIDDIQHRFEYQRTGALWSDLLLNIEWFKVNMPHNHMFNINCVWSYLNFYYLDELWRWYETTLSANRYGDPCRLILQKAIGPFQLRHLSAAAIEEVRQKFSGNQSLLSLLQDITCDQGDHAIFWEKVGEIDRVRGHDFREICPEWSAWL